MLARESTTVHDAPADNPLLLARLTGGALSRDGGGTSTVTFQPPANGAPPASGAAPANGAPPPNGAPPADGATDTSCAPATPVAESARQGAEDLDLDAIYDGFVQRLRRELIHDRERLGDLLGPMR
jgi:hypothetical protein